jgi:hypothetical protein
MSWGTATLWIVGGVLFVAGVCIYAALRLSGRVDDAVTSAEQEYLGAACRGMASVADGVGDVDPETAEELRRCQEAHDRLVEGLGGGAK